MDDKILPLGNISSINQLGDLIRQKRKSVNLTQFELSSLSSVGTRFVSELENGKPTLEISKVLQVLNALGLAFSVDLLTIPSPQADTTSTQKAGYKLLTPVHLEQFIQNHQTAVPIFKKENTLFLPQNGAIHSHVLKLAPLRYKSIISNEFFCTLLAKAINLATPDIEVPSQYENILLIKKPAISPAPAQESKRLLERTIYNFLIGNFHQDNHNHLFCTLVYPDFSPIKNNQHDWEQFAKDKKIKLKLIHDMLRALKEKILSEMENVFEHIDRNYNINIDVIPKICKIIEKRIST